MRHLLDGIERFRKRVFPQKRTLFTSLARGQRASAMMICCADSRVDMQLVTQSEPGSLFFCRNAGNLVPPHGQPGATSATIEYAMQGLEIANIVVCGHSDCGAMRALLEPASVREMPSVRAWLRHAEAPRRLIAADPSLQPNERLDRLVKANVLTQLQHIQTHPSVAARLADGRVALHGWVYDIQHGVVEVYDWETGRFASEVFEDPCFGSMPSPCLCEGASL
jgi:carbonic anhydrase